MYWPSKKLSQTYKNSQNELPRHRFYRGYNHTPERIILLSVEAYDWNCPKHITQRFSQEELHEAFGPKLERLAELEAEVAGLSAIIGD